MSTVGDDELRELVATLKHDLAKYVAWRSANFDDDAWVAPLTADFVSALQADVLRTKGDAPAWDVWRTFGEALGETSGHPELGLVAHAVAVLQSHEAALREGADALGRVCLEIREAQRTIRAALRDLQRRLGRG